MKAIEFKNVSFAYENNKYILNDISFVISENETVGLIGANGTGKSTILQLITGILINPNIFIFDKEVKQDNLNEIRKDIGFIFQNSDNQMFMPTVKEDMLFGLLQNGMQRNEAESRIDNILTSLNLMYLKEKYNHKISIGEKRMAAIATILAMEPKILLMDEPSSALDPYNRRQLINTINNLAMTKIITSHDLDLIYETCERIILINDGHIKADGFTKDILCNKKLLEDNHLELPLSLQKISI